MPFSSSNSSSSDTCSSGSGCDSTSDRSLISEAPLSNRALVSLDASQAFMDGVWVGFSRCPHGLCYTSLRVESLGVRRLARPSLHLGGRSWGFPNLCLSSLPPKLYPHISESFQLPSSYKLKATKDTKTVSQSPHHDH